MENIQIKVFEILGLATFIDPKSTRMRIKKTFFRILNAIYLITRTNEGKGRTDHYPSKELIAKVAKCSRCQVTEFINSQVFKEFCEVHREYDHLRKRFLPNRYILYQPVYECFRLFWRSGMMKNFLKRWDWWISDFKKRIYNWIIPLLDKGKTINDILKGVVNKLSTGKSSKAAAGKSAKPAGINPTGVIYEDYVLKPIRCDEPLQVPVLEEMTFICNDLKNRFQVKEADLNRILKYYRPIDFKRGYYVHSQWVKSGCKPKSPVSTLISAIHRGITESQYLRR